MQARIVREGTTALPLPADAPVANSSAIILGRLQSKHTRQSIASCHSKPEHWSEASPKDALACGLQLPVTSRHRGEKRLYGYLQQAHPRSFPAPLHNRYLLFRQPVKLVHDPVNLPLQCRGVRFRIRRLGGDNFFNELDYGLLL